MKSESPQVFAEAKELEEFFRSAGFIEHADFLQTAIEFSKEDMKLENEFGEQKLSECNNAIGEIRLAIHNIIQSSEPIKRQTLKQLIDDQWDAISTIRHIDAAPSFVRSACNNTMVEIEEIARMASFGPSEDNISLEDLISLKEISQRNRP